MQCLQAPTTALDPGLESGSHEEQDLHWHLLGRLRLWLGLCPVGQLHTCYSLLLWPDHLPTWQHCRKKKKVVAKLCLNLQCKPTWFVYFQAPSLAGVSKKKGWILLWRETSGKGLKLFPLICCISNTRWKWSVCVPPCEGAEVWNVSVLCSVSALPFSGKHVCR